MSGLGYLPLSALVRSLLSFASFASASHIIWSSLFASLSSASCSPVVRPTVGADCCSAGGAAFGIGGDGSAAVASTGMCVATVVAATESSIAASVSDRIVPGLRISGLTSWAYWVTAPCYCVGSISTIAFLDYVNKKSNVVQHTCDATSTYKPWSIPRMTFRNV